MRSCLCRWSAAVGTKGIHATLSRFPCGQQKRGFSRLGPGLILVSEISMFTGTKKNRCKDSLGNHQAGRSASWFSYFIIIIFLIRTNSSGFQNIKDKCNIAPCKSSKTLAYLKETFLDAGLTQLALPLFCTILNPSIS